MAIKKMTALLLTSAVVLGAASGCSLTKIEFDTDEISKVDASSFQDALDEIGMSSSDIVVYEDDYFNFSTDPDEVYYVDIDIDATADATYYSYAECVDEETAQNLFNYYAEGTYADVIDGSEGSFTGRKGIQIEDGNSYIILDGEYTVDDTYYVYHDIVVLKDNVVFIAWIDCSSEDEVSDAKKEIDDFLDALGLKVF
ncbi:MAG: hypothetical protein K5745_06260 [Saccharofermentans sp.]|nr:hypothetical protein [Saccharofermentans sp.]